MPTDESTVDETPVDPSGENEPSLANERMRVIRQRMDTARTKIESALTYVMYPEVRQELRQARTELAVALMWCDETKSEG